MLAIVPRRPIPGPMDVARRGSYDCALRNQWSSTASTTW